MRPSTLALATALLAATGGAAAAQSYDRGYAQPQSQYGRPQPSNDYPSSSYDRGQPQRGYDQGGQQRGYDEGGAAGRGQEQEPDLARELSLRRDQQAALASYRAAFQPDEARARAAEAMAQRLPTMTTPQRLDFTRSEMERERADFARTDAATRAFYAQLDTRQRQSFDRITAPEPETGDDGDDRPTPGEPTRPR